MNCEQGDIAVIVGGKFPVENIGKQVEVLELIGSLPGGTDLTAPDGRKWFCAKSIGPTWWVKSLGSPFVLARGINSPRVVPVADCYLRPLRDKPGEDEMVTRVGKPQPVYLLVPLWVTQ